jgi:carboxyvinyl-carboxyphosphonate phosphorylmutase
MHWTDRRQRFRAVLAGAHCVHPGSVFDPISARIAEELGFEVGMFAGSIASFTVLGAPDLIVLTLTEFAAQAYRINRAGKLPLLVDADHGYGNALNVMRTVQELETAGVAAMCIEDTLLPKTYGEKQPSLISLEEGVGKMRAAVAARIRRSSSSTHQRAAMTEPRTWCDVPRRMRRPASMRCSSPARDARTARCDPLAVKLPPMMAVATGDRRDIWRAGACALPGISRSRRGAGGLQHVEGREGTRPGDLPAIASAETCSGSRGAATTRAGR